MMNIVIQILQNLRSSVRYSGGSQLVPIVGSLIILLAVGSVSYSFLEGWSPLDSVYATVITITTVGYGDLTPATPAGRIFAIGFTLFAISLGGYAISTFAVYFVENRQRTLARRFRKRLMNTLDNFTDHYILCGANLIGTRIAEEFYTHGVDFVIIDDNEEHIKRAILYAYPEYFEQKIQTLVDFHEVDLSEFEDASLPEISERVGVPYILSDPTDDNALLQAGIGRAQGILAAAGNDGDNLSILIGARSLAQRSNNTDIRIMAVAIDPRNMRKMYLAGADYVRTPSIVSGMEMASHIMSPEIGNWWYSRTGATRTKHSIFNQVDIQAGHDWVNKTVSDVHKSDQIVVASVKRNAEFVSPPPFDFVLQAGDIAIVIR